MDSGLGGCINQKCDFGCAVFFPAELATHLSPLAQKCLCGHLGMQHAQGAKEPVHAKARHENTSPSDAPPVFGAAPLPQPHPFTYAPPNSASGTQAPLRSTSEAAQRARERAAQQCRDDTRFEKAFNTNKTNEPTASSSYTGFTSKKQKRKGDDPDTSSGSVSKKAKSTSSSKPQPTRVFKAGEQTTFLFCLVHDTPTIDKAEESPSNKVGLEHPTPASLSVLMVNGYLIPIPLSVDDSPATIYGKVLQAFVGTEHVNGDVQKLADYRLLIRIPQGHGGRVLLKPMKNAVGGSLTYHQLYTARLPAHRQAKSEYKNIVYIALSRGEKKIAVPGLSQYGSHVDDTSDEDSPNEKVDSSDDGSENSDDESDFLFKSKTSKKEPKEKEEDGKAKGKGDGKAKGDGEAKVDMDEKSAPGVKGDALDPSSWALAHRLTVNVLSHAPTQKPHPWFPPTIRFPYARIHAELDALVKIRDDVALHPTSTGYLIHLFPAVRKFLTSLSFLTELAERSRIAETGPNSFDPAFEDEFDDVFRLGPHGLGPVLDTMHTVLRMLQACGKRDIGIPLCNSIIDDMEPTGLSVLQLVLVFRSRLGARRFLFDPLGFSTLRSALSSKNSLFGEADPASQLQILSLDLSVATLEDFQDALVEDFSTYHDYSQLKDSNILVGPFGITGMIEKVFDPILDSMPLERPEYQAILEALDHFAAILGRRINNFKKSHSKRPQASTDGPSKSNEAPKTRSKSKGVDGTM
ncbi:hypothetical protein DFP72DRAFT_839194 [Ephemerocybe angulata]|uniref:Uncharacterized protein n=1 Tax=Ephemerocybe angulata TaxID=980116 RepID=A0A8H6II32_9AGAR|nr:hypothetical protein DFP72DRAFT_839194 [Tulosesus angulatus]